MTANTWTRAALLSTRNHRIAELLACLIGGAMVIDRDGKKEVIVRLYSETDQRAALGIAAWDAGEHCTALVTHDMSAFKVMDLTGLVNAIRQS